MLAERPQVRSSVVGTVQPQAGESETLEVLVEGEQSGLILDGERSEQSVLGGERQAALASLTKDAGCGHIAGEPARLDQRPACQKPRDLGHIAFEALQNLGHDHAREHEPSARADQTLQLVTRASAIRVEKINPDGTVDQDQTRSLRMAFKSPRQMPLPR